MKEIIEILKTIVRIEKKFVSNKETMKERKGQKFQELLLVNFIFRYE